jgi:hypothetical protein
MSWMPNLKKSKTTKRRADYSYKGVSSIQAWTEAHACFVYTARFDYQG